MRRFWTPGAAVLLAAAVLTGCAGGEAADPRPAGSPEIAGTAAPAPTEGPGTPEIIKTEEKEEMTLTLKIGDTPVAVAWEENESVSALAALCREGPRTVSMEMYGGFEQVGALGAALPRQDTQTTTRAGDIVLYSGDQIVVFYGSNSWAYTRLGHITDRDADALRDLLGNGDVTLTLALEG